MKQRTDIQNMKFGQDLEMRYNFRLFLMFLIGIDACGAIEQNRNFFTGHRDFRPFTQKQADNRVPLNRVAARKTSVWKQCVMWSGMTPPQH